MPLPTIEWNDGKVRMIDQTLLPNELKYIDCVTIEEVWEAIKVLKVRGAPAIGIAGELGAVLGIWKSDAKSYSDFNDQLIQKTCEKFGCVLATNDADFVSSPLDIISANRRLLNPT